MQSGNRGLRVTLMYCFGLSRLLSGITMELGVRVGLYGEDGCGTLIVVIVVE